MLRRVGFGLAFAARPLPALAEAGAPNAGDTA